MNRKRCLLVTVIAAAAVLSLVSACSTSSNNQPIIASLEPGMEWVVPLGSLQVVCIASDPDGDELSYDWSASAGGVSGDGDTVTWTAPASEGSYSIAVVVTDGQGGEVMDFVAITVRVNSPPTIASLAANAEWTTRSGNLQVTCTASDADGDELSYAWSSSAGNISGTGSSVSWTAPQQVGIYDVTVVARDGYDGSATKTVRISVVTGQPPIIQALNITAKHCYLKPIPSGYYVGKGQIYEIESIVADTGVELFYGWSCTGGVISGEGSSITWTAPDASVDVTVKVTVSDISGSKASKDITLTVVSCSFCIFGC